MFKVLLVISVTLFYLYYLMMGVDAGYQITRLDAAKIAPPAPVSVICG